MTAASIVLALFTLATAAASSEPTLRLAVETDDADLVEALQDGPMQRWVLPRRHDLSLEIGPRVEADVLVQACRLPVHGPKAATLTRQLGGLPTSVDSGGFRLGDDHYRADDLAFALRLPETRHWIACGGDVEKTAGVVQLVLLHEAGARRVAPFDYLVFEHSHSQRSGNWQQSAEGIGLDPDERDDLRAREKIYASSWSIERQHVRLRVPAAARRDPRAPDLADRLDAAVSKLHARLGRTAAESAPERVEIIVENDHVEQGRHTGAIDPAVLFRHRLHLVYHPDDIDFYRFEAARLLIRRAGTELPPVLEDGAALWLAERWYGRSFDEWMPHLAFADVLPGAAEIAAPERPEDGSRMIFAPAVAWGLDQLPGATLAEKLRGAPKSRIHPSVEGLAGLVAETLAGELGRASTSARQPIDSEESENGPSHGAGSRPRLPFQQGISFAMANGLELGYHAPGVDDQLERLRRMGADAVSLMPFAYQPRPDGPALSFLNRSPSSETDVGVVHAARRARERDFFVLWKPHIWVSHQSWPGEIAMHSEAEWRAWFRTYRRYVVHHAMLADFAGASLFSIGVELGQTVERETEWRHLIEAVRRITDIPLTYAGNWWGDYERVPFWDALDVVGVDAYFPLAGEDDVSDAELREGARRIVERLAKDAERYGRPILLTEVGYAARRGAWISPHEEGGELSSEDQHRAWSALLAELGRPTWLRGLYAWKVFSHPRAERTGRPDFRLLERPARVALERYFEGERAVLSAE